MHVLSGLFLFVVLGVSLSIQAPLVAASCNPDTEQEVTIGVEKPDGTITHCVPKNSTGLNDNPIIIFLRSVLQFFAIGVGLLVTGGIVTGGVLYMTARGNTGQVEKAQEIIRNSLIGLLLFLGLFAGINFLIPGGVLQ